MGSTRNRRLLSPVVAGIVAACATAGGVKSDPLDAGEAKFYTSPFSTIVPAARQAVLAAGLDVDQTLRPDSSTVMIIAKKGMSLLSYGEVVRVVVQQPPEGPVAVRVLTKRRLATNITAQGDWSGPVFEHLDQILTPH
jgi:hypothetical protein